MKRFLQGVGVGGILLALLGLAQQSQQATEQPVVQRYVIYGGDDDPILLDSQTGRTWYVQAGPLDSAGDETESSWAPAKFVPDDSSYVRSYRPPPGDR
jgi:hypothetical protein